MALDIAVICPNIRRRDGQGRVMLEISRALAVRGHRVHAYSSTCAPELLHLPTFSWRKVFMPKGPDVLSLSVFAVTASRASRERKHDAVVIMGGCAAPRGNIAYYAPFAQRTWQAVRAQTSIPSLHQRLFGRFAVWLEARAVSRARLLMPTSVKIGEELAPLLGPDTQIQVVPGGVEISEFPVVDQVARAGARERLGIPSDVFVVSMVGEYATGRKGAEPLVRAVADGPDDERVILHGEGPKAKLEAHLASMGAEKKVLFLDPKIPVPIIMAASDVVAIPSFYEPFSLVALEAAASGLPIVISERAGAAGYLSGACIQIDPDHPSQIRHALDRIRGEAGLGASLGAAARRKAEEMTWENVSGEAAEGIIGLAAGAPDA